MSASLRARCIRVSICLTLFAVACGEDEKREELEKSDSAVTEGPPTSAPPAVPGTPDAAVVEQPPAPPFSPVGELDASQEPVGPDLDAALPPVDASVPVVVHPLSGHYAVRTVSYARQKTVVGGQTVDLVSKGVLLSVADVSESGLITEHLCLIELYNEEGLFSWSSPSGTERVPDSVVLLERRGEVYVRPRDEDKTLVAWSNANRPSDCTVDGSTHSSGCLCVLGDALPTLPNDCRLKDLDGDTVPGLKLSVGVERPVDPALAESLISVQVAGVKAVEWRLPLAGEARLVGTVEGTIEQSQLSVQGDFADELGTVRNASCSSDTGHVELVRGDFDCAKLFAARRTNVDSYGVFDLTLDAKAPDIASCPDPDCAVDSDRDGTADCTDTCPSDPLKLAPGECGCGVADADENRDGVLDCRDSCPNDPGKTTPGRCGCGVADTDSDGDGEPDCTDECDADAKKTKRGACDCGVADTDRDSDGAPDCLDACDDDPKKTAEGACGCGVADGNADNDSLPDCKDRCPNDPNKTEPGICNCGVRDADLNGDGSIDCSDACPNDPVKVAPGACGCGVPDSNADNDSEPDCRDECPNDPALTKKGECGCVPCATNPLVGTYAVRTSIYGKQRNGTDNTAATASKVVGYSLVTISAQGNNGGATLSERSCWAETLPDPAGGGIKPYSWVKPAWAQTLAPAVRPLVRGTGDTWVGTSAAERTGWASGQQPSSCSASSPSPASWPDDWGSTCTCNAPASALPPYDRDGVPYDCRLTDPDGDGYPGVSVFVDISAPSDPASEPRAFTGGRAMAVSEGSTTWTITPASDGRHRATIADNTTTMVVGCVGTACSGLGATTPRSKVCPEALNKAQFVPVTAAYDTCAEILAQRTSLFVANQDGPWPDGNACSPP